MPPKGKAGGIWHAATQGSTEEVVKYLKETPALVNSQDEEGNTPLMCACKSAQLDVVCVLLTQEGIHIDISNNDGCTPVWVTASNGEVVILGHLLAAGARYDVRGPEGTTALEEAIAGGLTKCAVMLKVSGT